MAEERCHASCAIQMTSAFPPSRRAVYLTPPLAEHALAEDTIRQLALNIHEAGLGPFKPQRSGILPKVFHHFRKLWAETVMLPPQFIVRHKPWVFVAPNRLAKEEFSWFLVAKDAVVPRKPLANVLVGPRVGESEQRLPANLWSGVIL